VDASHSYIASVAARRNVASTANTFHDVFLTDGRRNHNAFLTANAFHYVFLTRGRRNHNVFLTTIRGGNLDASQLESVRPVSVESFWQAGDLASDRR
jgi:hypothetical protein